MFTIFLTKNNLKETEYPVVVKRLKDPTTKTFLTNVYVKNKGTFVWYSLQNKYCSTKDYSFLTKKDMSDIIWDLSY